MNKRLRPWYIALIAVDSIIAISWISLYINWSGFFSFLACILPTAMIFLSVGVIGMCIETKTKNLDVLTVVYAISVCVSVAVLIILNSKPYPYDGIPREAMVTLFIVIPAASASFIMIFVSRVRRIFIINNKYDAFLAEDKKCFTKKRYIVILSLLTIIVILDIYDLCSAGGML